MEQNNLFATPENMEAIEAYITTFSGTERTAATVAAGMMWNLACKIHKQIMENKDA